MLTIESLYESLAATAEDDMPGSTAMVTRAEQMAHSQEAASADTSNEQLREMFARIEGVSTIAVVENGRPIGLVNRHVFMEQYAKPYARDLYGRKSCMAFMDKSPLIVSVSTPVEVLVKAAVASGGKVLDDGFITTLNGEYHGVGTGFGLMKAMSEIEAEKTRQLMASINYASLIQRSHLVESDQVLRHDVGDYGLLWMPRDVVGGDAYFFRKVADGVFGCVFDCTGHGVPGAFMTLIVLSFLEQVVVPDASGIDPGAVLAQMHGYIKRVLRQEDRSASDTASDEKASNDGLDAAAFVLATDHSGLRFASAKLSLLVAREGSTEIEVLDADKHGIGYADTPLATQWTTRQIVLGPQCMVVIPTDGVIDQIGGSKSIAHGRRRLVQFMAEHRPLDAAQLMRTFDNHFSQWQGSQKRRDDVTLLAFGTRRR